MTTTVSKPSTRPATASVSSLPSVTLKPVPVGQATPIKPQGILPGGCVHPGFPGRDIFVPRCPPPPVFPGLELLAFKRKLDGMSDTMLKVQLSALSSAKFLAEARGDKKGAAAIQAKIDLVHAEIASRKNPYGKEYEAKLDKMSNKELQAELKSAEGQLWVAQHGFVYNPEQVAKAQARLAAVRAEFRERGLPVPFDLTPFGR